MLLKHEAHGQPSVGAVLVLPPQIFVYDVSNPGSIEQAPLWAKVATTNYLSAEKGYLVEQPAYLSDDFSFSQTELMSIGLHINLGKVINTSIAKLSDQSTNAWRHKLHPLDFTLGEGLRFLKTKYNVDAVIMTFGRVNISQKQFDVTMQTDITRAVISTRDGNYLHFARMRDNQSKCLFDPIEANQMIHKMASK